MQELGYFELNKLEKKFVLGYLLDGQELARVSEIWGHNVVHPQMSQEESLGTHHAEARGSNDPPRAPNRRRAPQG